MNPFMMETLRMELMNLDNDVERILRDLGPNTDLVENLFQNLPCPSTDYVSYNGPETATAMHVFLAASKRWGSQSPEQDSLIAEHAGDVDLPKSPTQFVARLAVLALSTTTSDEDVSLRAQHLRYLRWVIRGRKDDEWPFTTTVSSVDHSVLPEPSTPTPCAACGNTKPSMQSCTGCKFLTDSATTFATNYCDKACQKAHWQQHKSYCKFLRMVCRSVSIFEKIFTTYTEMAADWGAGISKIWEEDGILKIHMPSASADLESGYKGAPILRKIPAVTGASREQQVAAMMLGRCGDMSRGARHLFDYFLQRMSCRINPFPRTGY